MFLTLEKCPGAGLPATCEDIHRTLYPIAPMRGGGSAGMPRGACAAFRPRRMKGYIENISNYSLSGFALIRGRWHHPRRLKGAL